MRREAVAAVGADYSDKDAALRAIASRLCDFYKTRPGAAANLVNRVVSATPDVWARDVFPAMNVKWGTYPNHVSQVDSPGCFRCHDDEHATKDGGVLKQDCEMCHKMCHKGEQQPQ